LIVASVENYIEEFKFPSKEETTDEGIFPRNGFNEVLFSRKILINRFLEDVMTSVDRSFYLRGPRGSGKTLLSYLIGKELQSRGETVYYIKHAGKLSNLNEENLKNFEKRLADGKKLYLLIDEVHNDTNSALWLYLLKQETRTVTIGFGIPRIQNPSPAFQIKYEPSYVLLRKEDFIGEEENLRYLAKLADISDMTVISDLMDWMLEYTGGHTFPFMKLCEHFLVNHKKSCMKRDFESVVHNETFYKSPIYKLIISRAFDLGYEQRESAYEILGKGVASLFHINRLNKSGLWNNDTGWFLSNLLLSHLFQMYGENPENHPKEIIDLSSPDGLQNVLLYGLSNLKEDDFKEPDGINDRYENALGTILAIKIRQIDHLYIAPQIQVIDGNKRTRGSKPTIDFYFNEKLNRYLELTRNGLDLKKHFDKFESPEGKYYAHRKNYVILDFVLSKPNPSQVPKEYDTEEIKKRMYSFVKSKNALYLGNKLIRHGVSKYLQTPPLKRMFSTIIRRLR
jgi:hypothetical protein